MKIEADRFGMSYIPIREPKPSEKTRSVRVGRELAVLLDSRERVLGLELRNAEVLDLLKRSLS